MKWSYFHGVVLIVCLILFSINSLDVFITFWRQESTVGISYEPHTTLPLPTLTLCPYSEDNRLVDFTTSTYEEFDLNSFSEREIFWEHFTNWPLKETLSTAWGRCFTTNASDSYVKTRQIKYLFQITKNLSAYVFIHSPGDELWLWSVNYPFPINQVKLEARTGNKSSIGTDLHIKKFIKKLLPDKTGCKHYEANESMNSCALQKMVNYLESNVTCYSFLFRHFAVMSAKDDNWLQDLPKCRPIDVENSLDFFRLLADSPAEHGCPQSCDIESYQVAEVIFRSFGLMNPNWNCIYTMYDSTTVEITTEIPIYDSTRLIGGIGGSLGLYLGFSFFGMVKDSTSALSRLWSKAKKKHDLISINV